MAYSPPAFNAVDFTGSGIVGCPLRLMRLISGISSGVAGGALPVKTFPIWRAVHQLATASLSVGPSVVAVAVHQKADAVLGVEPVVYAEAWKTFYASSALSVSPVSAGVASTSMRHRLRC